ncbi:MAG: exonuclease domain-containing protein [Nonlabens sp.]|nr:exonuclease domain-containing protein [Nonlabens sp.]
MYAIVDVETTGGKFNEEGITEIAIYRYDGQEIVDSFASLINPEKEIQPFVVQLTGINNKMLVNAPKFYEVAKRIIEIMDGAVLVAHNASFDYRMLRIEFDRLGYEFELQTLCTVELAQKLLPDQESYSLGKLVRSLGIPITDRHRATGDALATVKLFDLLLRKDLNNVIVQATLKTIKTKSIAPNLKRLIEDTPPSTGVYYLYDSDDTLLYIGKGRNMRKHLTKQMTSEHHRAIELRGKVHSLRFEKTGNELIANLKEHVEILKNRPKYNKLPSKKPFTHAWIKQESDNGIKQIKVRNAGDHDGFVTTFSSRKSAISALEKSILQFKLCNKMSSLETGTGACTLVAEGVCEGICIQNETVDKYNLRVEELMTKYSYNQRTMVIIDRGRTAAEQSVLFIENGIFQGYTYVNLQIQFKDTKFLKNRITMLDETPHIKHIIHTYIRHKHGLRLIDIP